MVLAPLLLLGLAACSAPNLNDPRAQALVAMDGPQHYADRAVARELAGRCTRYAYDEELAQAMSQQRLKSRQSTAIEVRGATDLETTMKRRSLGVQYDGDYATLDPCVILDGETARQTPLSVLVRKRG